MESSTASAGPRWFFANLVEVKLTRQAGGGAMSIVELTGPPGDMPPLHLHRDDDETRYVLEGEMSFFVGTGEPTRGGPGSLAFGPKRGRRLRRPPPRLEGRNPVTNSASGWESDEVRIG
jgi:quercetin dioxygenase-like cupin family protein